MMVASVRAVFVTRFHVPWDNSVNINAVIDAVATTLGFRNIPLTSLQDNQGYRIFLRKTNVFYAVLHRKIPLLSKRDFSTIFAFEVVKKSALSCLFPVFSGGCAIFLAAPAFFGQKCAKKYKL
jgi:hypothetical protein